MTFPDDIDRITSCYHEAGHALFAHLLGAEVAQVTIEGDDDGEAGSTTVRWRGLDAAERRNRSVLVALAGPIAEAWWQQDGDIVRRIATWQRDFAEVEAALSEHPVRDRPGLLQRWIGRVRAELTGPIAWEYVCRLADSLDAHGTLEAEQIADVVEGVR